MTGPVRSATFGLAALMVAAGCALPRSPILGGVPVDSGPSPDVPGFDAPELDAPELDAPGLDAPELDAPVRDAPMRDAPPPIDAPDAPPPCIGRAETCNGRDDDCNGAIDDGVLCRACTAPGSCDDCVRFEAGGRVYQSCPAVTGLVYWRRICDTLGDGYDLAVPGTASESDSIAARLRDGALGINANHWIGVNDFETNGSYVEVGGSPLGWSPSFSDIFEPQDGEGVVVIEPDGEWDDYPIDWSHRLLCELEPTAPRCAVMAASDASCDGVDDDCDGLWDEDCTGSASCTARVFWDEVYYVCLDNMNFAEARTACQADGGDLAVLDDRFAIAFAADFTSEDTWTGLEQSAAGSEPDGGWSWIDGTSFTPSDADWDATWDTAQPSSMTTEDCAFLKDSASQLQDHDCTTDRTRSLCAQALVR